MLKTDKKDSWRERKEGMNHDEDVGKHENRQDVFQVMLQEKMRLRIKG